MLDYMQSECIKNKIDFQLQVNGNIHHMTNKYLGKKPSTTHKDNSGTGIGFMNTFDTLRKRNASLIIKEYGKPCDNNFTKILMIIFDGKQEYKICSYRWEKIQKKNIDKDIKIEKI